MSANSIVPSGFVDGDNNVYTWSSFVKEYSDFKSVNKQTNYENFYF